MCQTLCRVLGVLANKTEALCDLWGLLPLGVLQAWLDPGACMALMEVGLFLFLDSVVLSVASFSGSFTRHPNPQSSRLTSIQEPIPEPITLTKEG